ncbi:MAG: hypothetical protein GY820_18855 [Gammaproteobacteria bacterium]|nr:hypothetical protein [Gammaproteobacteria bacterium]
MVDSGGEAIGVDGAAATDDIAAGRGGLGDGVKHNPGKNSRTDSCADIFLYILFIHLYPRN